MTAFGPRGWNTATAITGVMFALLVGCSARQQTPSMPTPPTPPTGTPTPSSPSPAGGTPSTLPPSAETPSPERSDGGEAEAEARADGTEAASRGSSGGSEPSESEAGEAASSDTAGVSGSATTPEERRAGLEGKLDESLREFDGLILKEQELLEERREETADGGGANGGGIAGYGYDAGDGADAESREEPARMAGGTGGSPDAPPDSTSEESGAIAGSDPEATDDNGRVPPDVGDGRDDDIVARQLREAAMEEDDPELRERLWDEYRAYKNSTK